MQKQATQDVSMWSKKVHVYDLSRPQLLNIDHVAIFSFDETPLDDPFVEDLFDKIRAANIYLDKDEYAQQKGYHRIDHKGGAAISYHNRPPTNIRTSKGYHMFIHKTLVDVGKEMAEEFSQFLEERRIGHERGLDWIPDWQGRRQPLDYEFWLKRKPTILELGEIVAVPYVRNASLYIQFNPSPCIDVWVEEV